MNELYTTPSTNPDRGIKSSFNLTESNKKRKLWKRVIKWSVAGVIIPILLAAIGSVVGLSRAFQQLESNNADPAKLAQDISTALHSGIFGSLVSIIALIVLIIAMVKFFGIRKNIRKHSLSQQNQAI